VTDFAVLVTGSRNENIDDAAVRRELDAVTHGAERVTLYVGCANGVDAAARDWWFLTVNDTWTRTSPASMVELYEAEHGSRMFVFLADWRPDGKKLDLSAGPKRNSRMVKWAQAGGCKTFRAFPAVGAVNKGTKDCRGKAERAGMVGKDVEVALCL
jgi:hypothetical protein